MPSTHTSIHIHATFSTKDRFPFIHGEWRARLHEYLGGALRGLDAKPLETGGVADHTHLLFGIKPTHCVADLIREIKKASTAWIRDAIGVRKFHWQDGYGAFAVSRPDTAIRKNITGDDPSRRSIGRFWKRTGSIMTSGICGEWLAPLRGAEVCLAFHVPGVFDAPATFWHAFGVPAAPDASSRCLTIT